MIGNHVHIATNQLLLKTIEEERWLESPITNLAEQIKKTP